jgi:hypothetical protein
METQPVRNDFRKAMGSVVLTAGATLADAERLIIQASALKKRKTEQDVSLVKEFCRLLIAPVEEYGPGFADIPGFAETYCRTHLSLATDFLRRSMATHNPGSPECKRLAHTAGLVERNLKQHLDEKIAIRCWFGDRIP